MTGTMTVMPTLTEKMIEFDSLISVRRKEYCVMLFEDPKLNVMHFEVADILTVSETESEYSGPVNLPEIPG